ncbi:MAG: hypothetical protein ACREAK_08155 [Nitrosarchaeum sp.]
MKHYLGFTTKFDKDTNPLVKVLSTIILLSGIPQMIYMIISFRELGKELKEMEKSKDV